MKKIKTRDIIFVVVGILFLVFVGYSMNFSKDWGKKIAEDFYVNAKGQKWTLPDTPTYEFTASSGQYPKFLSGKIEPPKVKVGDTQRLTIRIASPAPMKSVKAVTDTDTKTQELELQLVESKALSGNYFRAQPYLVNDKGELVVNSTNATYAEKAIEQIISKAEAQALVEYTYSGEWVVNDTHTTTYHTKFLAEAENGDKNILTLAWSDPVCEFSASGDLLNGEGCRFGDSIEGFDGGDININPGQTVTIESGGVFMWNGDEGKKITVTGIFVMNGGSIAQGGIYFDDIDQDTWPGSLAFSRACEGQCTPQVRIKDSPARPWNPDFATYPNGAIDCKDNDSAVNPGAPYHTDGPGSNNWDYNCSGIVEGGWQSSTIENPATVSASGYMVTNGGQGYLSYAFGTDECGELSPEIPIDMCDINQAPKECVLSSFKIRDTENITGGNNIENGWMGSDENCVKAFCFQGQIRGFCK